MAFSLDWNTTLERRIKNRCSKWNVVFPNTLRSQFYPFKHFHQLPPTFFEVWNKVTYFATRLLLAFSCETTSQNFGKVTQVYGNSSIKTPGRFYVSLGLKWTNSKDDNQILH